MTYLGGGGNSQDANATTIAASFSPAVTAGSLLVAAISFDWGTSNNITVTGVADDRGNTWAVIPGTLSGDTANHQAVQLAYCMNAAAGATTVTATFSVTTDFRRIVLAEHSGVATSAALDKAAVNATTNTTATNNVTSSATAALAQADELVIGAVMDTANGANTQTAGTGFTKNPSTAFGLCAIEDRIVAATTGVAATWTFGTAGRYAALVATFKLASGGTTPVSTTRSTTWTVKARVTATKATTWDTLAVASALRATTWDVLTRVTQNRATTWTTKARVTTSRATTWNVRQTVTATRAALWDALLGATISRATTWDVLSGVTRTRATTWDTLTRVTATRATLWNVSSTSPTTSVSTTRSTTWDTLTTVASTRAASWDALARVTATRAATFDVLIATSATRPTTWDTLAARTQTRATSWRTLATVEASRLTRWAVESDAPVMLPPPDRLAVIRAELRIVPTVAENRFMPVAPEDRTTRS